MLFYIIYYIFICLSLISAQRSLPIIYSKERLNILRQKVQDAFDHAYNGYKTYGLPYDELLPLSCSGIGLKRSKYDHLYKQNTSSTCDDNTVLTGIFLTLIDSLDTIALMGKKEEFHWAISYLSENLDFDIDNMVNVFEITIRALGGLLSAHNIAQDKRFGMYEPGQYNGELLSMAHDLGKRLLMASNSPGIMYNRVNLKTGETGENLEQHYGNETNPAAACSLLLEFSTLSRLVGNDSFEKAAFNTFELVWNMRTRNNLLGSLIQINTSRFLNYDSGIGANLDSAFEYMLKYAIMSQNDTFLEMFKTSYEAIMKYIRQPDGFCYYPIDIYSMNTINSVTEGLAAYFPGLQVIYGDLTEAIHHHLHYYTLWLYYHCLPEVYHVDAMQPISPAYHLRPELMESTYYLYRATKDPFYLRAGEIMLNDIITLTKTNCGFAFIDDIITGTLGDRMNSFLLSETFKYLYLLFSPDHIIHTNDELATSLVFNTEAHPLPIFNVVNKDFKLGKDRCKLYPRMNSPLISNAHNLFQISEALSHLNIFDYERMTNFMKTIHNDPYLYPYIASKCIARDISKSASDIYESSYNVDKTISIILNISFPLDDIDGNPLYLPVVNKKFIDDWNDQDLTLKLQRISKYQWKCISYRDIVFIHSDKNMMTFESFSNHIISHDEIQKSLCKHLSLRFFVHISISTKLQEITMMALPMKETCTYLLNDGEFVVLYADGDDICKLLNENESLNIFDNTRPLILVLRQSRWCSPFQLENALRKVLSNGSILLFVHEKDQHFLGYFPKNSLIVDKLSDESLSLFTIPFSDGIKLLSEIEFESNSLFHKVSTNSNVRFITKYNTPPMKSQYYLSLALYGYDIDIDNSSIMIKSFQKLITGLFIDHETKGIDEISDSFSVARKVVAIHDYNPQLLKKFNILDQVTIGAYTLCIPHVMFYFISWVRSYEKSSFI